MQILLKHIITQNIQYFFTPGSDNEVMSSFMTLSNSKATDVSVIEVQPVKYVVDILAPFLRYIFNQSFSSGIFSRDMQIAKVTLIFKKREKMK